MSEIALASPKPNKSQFIREILQTWPELVQTCLKLVKTCLNLSDIIPQMLEHGIDLSALIFLSLSDLEKLNPIGNDSQIDLNLSKRVGGCQYWSRLVQACCSWS